MKYEKSLLIVITAHALPVSVRVFFKNLGIIGIYAPIVVFQK